MLVDEDDYAALEDIKTKLYPGPPSNTHYTYDRVPWTLKIRKEVFSPTETLNSPLAINLIFCQVKHLIDKYIIESGKIFLKWSISIKCYSFKINFRSSPMFSHHCVFDSLTKIEAEWKHYSTNIPSTWRPCFPIPTNWAQKRTSSKWQRTFQPIFRGK